MDAMPISQFKAQCLSVMDRVRSYSTVEAMEVVEAELFPVISLGDPPAKAT